MKHEIRNTKSETNLKSKIQNYFLFGFKFNTSCLFRTSYFGFRASSGIILVNVLIFGAIAVTVTSALVSWGAAVLRSTRSLDAREQAFQVAEAGIDYYRWHLAHAPNDYKDGTGVAGPYYHTVTDADGDIVGQYALTITPPPTGSTIVKIRSVGTTTADASAKRTIQATLAIPSLAKYAVAANAEMRFGEGTVVQGPVHSNGGIRFDGLANNLVTSGVASYDDPDHSESGADKLEFGVHTHVDVPPPAGNITDTYRPAETPPAVMQNRADVFAIGRQFPVPTFDFNGLTADLASLKAQATTSGAYFAASGTGFYGYYIVLKTNDTFDLYKITALQPAPGGCSNDLSETGWGTWSIQTKVHPTTGVVNSPRNYPFPSNGIIFFEDNLWVSGTIDGARLTIAAGKFPDNVATRKDIIVNNDLLYTRKDGTDVISLIAQGNITTGLFSDDNLEIDAALVAQNGRAGRFNYSSSCKSGGTNYYGRTVLTLYGMIATNQRYGFAWSGNIFNCGGTIGWTGGGYCTRNIVYDSYLLYGPPPSFPLTSSQYSTISWQEI